MWIASTVIAAIATRKKTRNTRSEKNTIVSLRKADHAGQPITWEDVYSATAITYPAVYRLPMKGETIKEALEGVADNLFYPDPYLQQGGDMVRVGGMAFTINVDVNP